MDTDLVKENTRLAVLLAKKKDVPEDTFDEMVHELKSREASSINNEGMGAQILFLLENGCTNEVMQALS